VVWNLIESEKWKDKNLKNTTEKGRKKEKGLSTALTNRQKRQKLTIREGKVGRPRRAKR